MRKNILLISVIIIIAAFISSCSKDPGPGGRASIYGKVYALNYNAELTNFLGEYYVPDFDVYIIYGDEKSYGERVRTCYDGTYEFKYLLPGKYHIYALSKDTLHPNGALLPVIKDVEITDKKQELEVEDIVVVK